MAISLGLASTTRAQTPTETPTEVVAPVLSPETASDNQNAHSIPSQPEETDLRPAPPARIETCLDAIAAAQAMAADLPDRLLLAIAMAESGRSVDGAFGPWPWTLNIAGEGLYFPERATALDAAHAALENGLGNVDLGCMQISETWHGWAFDGIEEMIDPRQNAFYAASHLQELYALHGGWAEAIAHYHTANPVRGYAYAQRVLGFWREISDEATILETDPAFEALPGLVEQLADVPVLDSVAEEYFASVTVSERYEVDVAYVARGIDGALYVSLADLAGVPFAHPFELPLVIYGDTPLIRLSAQDLFRTEFDLEANHLRIRAAGHLFPEFSTSRDGDITAEEISPRHPGFHLNYALSASATDGESIDPSAFLQAIGYWDNKTFETSLFLDADRGLSRRATRLEITDYALGRELVLGDTILRGGVRWGRTQPVFGLTFESDPDLNPAYTRFSDYEVFGLNDIPAVAELLVDGERVREIDLPPGPFRLTDLPFPDAYGNMTVAVEDIRGQTQYFEVPYIRVGTLLEEGVHTFRYGIGVQRQSGDNPLGEYRGLAAAATHRYGFSDVFTGELHAEFADGTFGIGATGDYAWLAANTIVSGTVAASFADGTNGATAQLSFGRLERDGLGWFDGSVRYTTRDFLRDADSDVDTERWSVRLSSSLGGLLPTTLNYQMIDRWSGDRSHAVSASRSWSMPADWTLSASASYRSTRDDEDALLFLNLSRSIGRNRDLRVAVSSAYTNERQTAGLTLSRPRRGDRGVSYQGRIDTAPDSGGIDRGSLLIDAEYERARFSGAFTAGPSGITGAATLAGSIGYLDGTLFRARDLTAPYALVRSGDATDLPIFRNHTPAGETNAAGVTVVNDLLSHARNRIEFRPEDLDFDFSMSGVQPVQTVVPAGLGGYVLNFPISEQFPATVILVDAAAKPLPRGAIAQNQTTGEAAGVTLDGMAYFENVDDGQRLQVDMGRFGTCEATLVLPPDFEKFDTVGPLRCD